MNECELSDLTQLIRDTTAGVRATTRRIVGLIVDIELARLNERARRELPQ